MTVEITGYSIRKGTINIYCIDASEENLQRIERYRDDGYEREIVFQFETRENPWVTKYLYQYLHRQQCTRGAKNWGEALQSIIGIQTQAPVKKYRIYED